MTPTGLTVWLYQGSTAVASVTAANDGSYTISPTSALTSGDYVFTIKTQNAIGNFSGNSPPLNVTIQTTPQAPTAPTLATSSDLGLSTSDNITSDDTPTLTGTASPNTVINIYDDTNTFVVSSTSDGTGAYSITLAALNDADTNDFYVELIDTYGNTATSTLLDLTIDTTAPVVDPVATDKKIAASSTTTYTTAGIDATDQVWLVPSTVSEADLKDYLANPSSVTSLTLGTNLTKQISGTTGTISTTSSGGIFNIVVVDLAGNFSSLSAGNLDVDLTNPTVQLTSSDNDNVLGVNGEVTITATFSEAMSNFPKITIGNIINTVTMSNISGTNSYEYTWDTSSGTLSTGLYNVTVSGNDLFNNPYSGTESITFNIDASPPLLSSFTDNHFESYVKSGNVVEIKATFNEAINSSTINIQNSSTSLLDNQTMTVSSSTNSKTWNYEWTVPNNIDGIYFATVSATDLLGNAYTGTESITYIVDNTSPEIESVVINNTNDLITLTFTEPTFMFDATSDSLTVTDTSYYLNVTTTGGTATITVNQVRYNANTDDRVYYLDITVNGITDGDELITVLPASASRFKDRAGNYASDTSQTSNTVYLTNTPPYIKGTSVLLSNLNVLLTFSEAVSTSSTTTADLVSEDFSFSITGGAARLSSPTPVSVTKLSNTLYELVLSYTSSPTGAEVLRVTPVANAIFDNKGTALVDETVIESLIPGLNAWYSVQLPDQKGPEVTATAIENQNNYVDFTFSEGVYATASPTTAVSSSSFTLSQQSGPSYTMSITSITTTSGAALSGGETIIRFNLDSGGIKPTGQEVFAITATDSSSVVDLKGNSMTVSQTNNTFQLRPPTSGGVSPEKSTIVVTPAQMIANGINTALITVQAKDTLGQNFFEGGYQVKIFGPDGDLATTDNQNGTYSASYTPETLFILEQENLFGFSVAQTQSPNQAVLTLYRDSDGDGVYNINDQCPGTEQGLAVDEKGCALSQLDSDNDGVFDDIDQCPDTPEFEINNVPGTPTYGQELPTVVDEFGCGSSQRDTDGDGIVDMEDNCIDNANPDQKDTDEDGIGDICDTNNPLPEVITTSIIIVQQPANGSVIGKIEAIDPDGEVLVFSQDEDDEFFGILSIDASGNITVNTGAILSYNSNYNGASLSFIVRDEGENEVKSSVKIVIEDAPLPPEISIITLEISEDAEVGTIAGFVEAKDPMGGQIEYQSSRGWFYRAS